MFISASKASGPHIVLYFCLACGSVSIGPTYFTECLEYADSHTLAPETLIFLLFVGCGQEVPFSLGMAYDHDIDCLKTVLGAVLG